METHPVGEDPDVLAFDPGLGRLYVASESGSVSVFEQRGRQLAPLGRLEAPHAHTVAVDPETHLVYLPLEDVERPAGPQDPGAVAGERRCRRRLRNSRSAALSVRSIAAS